MASYHIECWRKQYPYETRNSFSASFSSRCHAFGACLKGGTIKVGEQIYGFRNTNNGQTTRGRDKNKGFRGYGEFFEAEIKNAASQENSTKSSDQKSQQQNGSSGSQQNQDNEDYPLLLLCCDDKSAAPYLKEGEFYEGRISEGNATDFKVKGISPSVWNASRFHLIEKDPNFPLIVRCLDDYNGYGKIQQGYFYHARVNPKQLGEYILKGTNTDSWAANRFEVLYPKSEKQQKSSDQQWEEQFGSGKQNDKQNDKQDDKQDSKDQESGSEQSIQDAIQKLRPILEAMIREGIQAESAKLDKEAIIKHLTEQIEKMSVKQIEVKNLDTQSTQKVGVQHKQFELLLKTVASRVPVWLAGPSGSGKTTAAKAVAKALNLPFRYTGAVGDPYALLGYNDANGRYVRTQFREAWEHGGVFLWDEVDASDPNALLAFNAALANGTAPFPDAIIDQHQDCVLIAAANTWGHGATNDYVGRLKMDAAFLKRFAFLGWDYDEQLELATAPNKQWTKRVQEIREKVRNKGMRVLVTPRESYIGAQLLAAGIPQTTVEEMTVRSGMSQEQWDEVSGKKTFKSKSSW